MIFLEQFDFQFEYKPGRSHGNADAMSRQPSTDNMRMTQLVPVIKALEEEKPLPASSAPELCKTFIQNGLLCQKFQSFSPMAKTQPVIPSNKKATVLQQLLDNAGHLGCGKQLRV